MVVLFDLLLAELLSVSMSLKTGVDRVRQEVEERGRVLGQVHVDTIDARFNTACILYRQKMYQEAESMFRQVVKERKRMLGRECVRHDLDRLHISVLCFHCECKIVHTGPHPNVMTPPA